MESGLWLTNHCWLACVNVVLTAPLRLTNCRTWQESEGWGRSLNVTICQSVLINKCKMSSNSKTQLTLQDKFNGPHGSPKPAHHCVKKKEDTMRTQMGFFLCVFFSNENVDTPPTSLIISFAYNLAFWCLPSTEIISGDYCINITYLKLRNDE